MELITGQIVGSFIKELASVLFRIILGIVLFVVLSLVLVKILPDDPFREEIISFSIFMARYTRIINVFVPLRLIVSSLGFAVAWKYGLWIFKRFWSAAVEGSSADLSA